MPRGGTALADRAARGAQSLKPGAKITTVRDMVRQVIGDAGAIAPRGVDPDRIMQLAYTAMRADPKLLDCTAASLVGGLVMSLRLGLEIGGPLGQSYLVPFLNHGTLEAVWMLGYRGMIHLAYKSGQVESLAVVPVWPEDRYEVTLGTEWRVTHIPDIRADHDEHRARPMAYYMRAKLRGGEAFVLPPLSAVDIERHRSFSKGKNSPAWMEHYVAMASKTTVREGARYLPLAVDTAAAMAGDDTIVRADTDGLTVDTTAAPAPEPPPTPAPAARERIAVAQGPAPAGSQDAPLTAQANTGGDPRTTLRRELGRLRIAGADLGALLAPFSVVEVSALTDGGAETLAERLAGVPDGTAPAEAVAMALGGDE